jgi:hypothetical protein
MYKCTFRFFVPARLVLMLLATVAESLQHFCSFLKPQKHKTKSV